jgi:hypothetical protein
MRRPQKRKQGSQRSHATSETQHHLAAWLVVTDFNVSVVDPRNGCDEA